MSSPPLASIEEEVACGDNRTSIAVVVDELHDESDDITVLRAVRAPVSDNIFRVGEDGVDDESGAGVARRCREVQGAVWLDKR